MCGTLGLCGLLTAGAFAQALTFIETSSADSRIERLVLTPQGTPWMIVATPGARRHESAFQLVHWDGKTLRPPGDRGALLLGRDARPPEPFPVSRADTVSRSEAASNKNGPALASRGEDRRAPFQDREISVTGAYFTAAFFGGGDREAWAALRSPRDGGATGQLLKLGTGLIEASDTYRNQSAGRESPLYVARDGRVFNWGDSFLSCRQTNGAWVRAEAALPMNHRALPPVILERGDAVWFFVSPMLYGVGADGRVTARQVPGVPAGDRNTFAHRWGNNRIVVWPGEFQRPTVAFDIDTLEKAVWPVFPSGLNVWGAQAFSTRDGTLWLSCSEDRKMSTVLLRPDSLRPVVWPDVPPLAPKAGLGLGPTAFECADGTVASGADGLILIKRSGGMTRLGWTFGLTGPSSDLQEDREGRLWFVNSGRAVIFDRTRRPEPVPGADCWAELPVPNPGTDGVQTDGTNQPALSGGFFRYPKRADGYLEEGPVVREFGGHSLPICLEGTPLAGEYVMRVSEDAEGRLSFLAAPVQAVRAFATADGEGGVRSASVRRFRYTPPLGLAFFAPPPGTCGRSLEVPLTPGAARRQRAYLARAGDGLWQRVPDGRTLAARFRFPTNGVYRCEVIAFDYGGRVPGVASFTVAAQMELPETLHAGGGDVGAPVSVNAHPWFPPVRAVPSAGGDSARLVWRFSNEEAWRTFDPAAGISVVELGRGERPLLFSAEEDGFWRDPTPLRLEVRMALTLDGYLAALQQDLYSAPAARERALRALRDCGPDARARLDELNELAARGERIRAGIQVLRGQPQLDSRSPVDGNIPKTGGKE